MTTSSPGRPRPHLSLVIPAYNEERRLAPTLAKVVAYLQGRPYRSEIVVVSDGSRDGTEQVARAAFAGLPPSGQVEALVHAYQPNQGKGYAVRQGVSRTRGHFVAFTDADLSTPIEEVDRALSVLSEGSEETRGHSYQIVIGSRAVAGAQIRRYQPLYRRLSARFFNVLRDRLVGLRGLRDTQCGLKVFEGDLARGIFARQRINGFMFDVETMFVAQRLGVPVLELGVAWEDAPESKVRISSGLRLVPDLLRIRLAHSRLSPADRPARTVEASSAAPATGG